MITEKAILLDIDLQAEQDEEKVNALASAIKIGSMNSVLQFGADAVNQMNRLTDQILQRAQTSDLGDTGEQLTRIVVTAQEFDFDALDNPWSRIPIVGGLFRQLNSSQAKARARFQSVKTQVDGLVTTVERTAARLKARDKEYEEIYNQVRLGHEALGLYVAAIRKRLEEVGGEIAELQASGSGLDRAEKLAILEAAQAALAKRGDDLEVLRHSALQTLPMVRIIQSNNYAVLDKLATVLTLTLPAWKRAFMLAISMAEQKDANDLAVTIDDATNTLLRRNAELLRENSVAVARSSQRLVIDIETLKSVHDSVIATLTDVRKAHVEGQQQRANALTELATLRADFAIALQGGADEAA